MYYNIFLITLQGLDGYPRKPACAPDADYGWENHWAQRDEPSAADLLSISEN